MADTDRKVSWMQTRGSVEDRHAAIRAAFSPFKRFDTACVDAIITEAGEFFRGIDTAVLEIFRVTPFEVTPAFRRDFSRVTFTVRDTSIHVHPHGVIVEFGTPSRARADEIKRADPAISWEVKEA
jgi:hypothetical protein